MSEYNDDRYLWDGSGEPDPEIVRLEQILGRLRHRGKPPVLPKRASLWRRRRFTAVISLLAATLALVASGVWLAGMLSRSSWNVSQLTGSPVVDGRKVTGSTRLEIGGRLITDAISRARLAVGHIGQVDVDPNTRVQLVEARRGEHRMSLERGTIHARIWAPPKFFFVNTPAATAIDLGCAYTLHVDDDGSGLLRVTHGWVGFERDGREAYIPQGAARAKSADVCMSVLPHSRHRLRALRGSSLWPAIARR